VDIVRITIFVLVHLQVKRKDEEIMGEIISNNILLPIMYLLIDFGLVIGILVLIMILIEKLLDSKLINKIIRRY